MNQALSATTHTLDELVAEASRVLTICNACRYCEGFCAVFPAMTRRLDFAQDDVHYLANLCHNCGACLHACQYAAPHEFAVNIPLALSAVRAKTYQDYAWPPAVAKVYHESGAYMAMLLSGLFTALLLFAAHASHGLWRSGLGANFYAVFPHNTLAVLFGFSLLAATGALCVGVARFWRATHGTSLAHSAESGIKPPDLARAATEAATLKYLDGGHGEGCNEESDRYTHARRHLHHATAGGFMLCLASTSIATVYHYVFGWQAPYGWFSVPVILGTLGGIGMVAGTAGLLKLKLRRHPQHVDAAQKPMDVAFIVLLLAIAATGLLLLALRATPLMPLLLCIHLGPVLAFFITLPYGKFVHGAYRGAALLKWAIERRVPPNLRLGEGG